MYHYGRISIDTQIARFSTKMELNPEIWDAKTGRVTGKTKEVAKIKRTLDNLEQEIQSHYDRLVLEDGYVTAEAVKNALMVSGERLWSYSKNITKNLNFGWE